MFDDVRNIYISMNDVLDMLETLYDNMMSSLHAFTII